MSTCEHCRHWKALGSSAMRRTVIYDNRVVLIPPGPEGLCRALPPSADNRWPITMGADGCGLYSPLAMPMPMGFGDGRSEMGDGGSEIGNAEILKPDGRQVVMKQFLDTMAATPAAQPGGEPGAAVLSTGGAETDEPVKELSLAEAEPATASKKGAFAPLQPGRRAGQRADRGNSQPHNEK